LYIALLLEEKEEIFHSKKKKRKRSVCNKQEAGPPSLVREKCAVPRPAPRSEKKKIDRLCLEGKEKVLARHLSKTQKRDTCAICKKGNRALLYQGRKDDLGKEHL